MNAVPIDHSVLDQLEPIERFEIVAELYYKRFGRLAPGKSEPMETGRSSSDDENVAQFQKWVKSGQAWEDALTYISKARRVIDSLEDRIDDLECELVEERFP